MIAKIGSDRLCLREGLLCCRQKVAIWYVGCRNLQYEIINANKNSKGSKQHNQHCLRSPMPGGML